MDTREENEKALSLPLSGQRGPGDVFQGAARGRAHPTLDSCLRLAGSSHPTALTWGSCLLDLSWVPSARDNWVPRVPFEMPHPIPEMTDLWAGKIFLMSFSLFHDCLQSNRPRSFNFSDLGDGIQGRLSNARWDRGRAALPYLGL